MTKNLNEWYDRLAEPYRFILALIITLPIWSLSFCKNHPTVLMGFSIYTVFFLLFVMIPRVHYMYRAKRGT